MICARFKENRECVPTDYWQLSVTLKKGDDFRQFRHVENIPKKTEADRLYDPDHHRFDGDDYENGAQTGFPGPSLAV